MRNVEYLQFVDMKMLQQCATMDYIVYNIGARSCRNYSKNKDALSIQKGEGLVTEVFDQEKISKKMKGDHAIGHVRYSTAGGGGIHNVSNHYYLEL